MADVINEPAEAPQDLTAAPEPPRRLNGLEQAAMDFFQAEINKAQKMLEQWVKARAKAMEEAGIPGDGSKLVIDGLVVDNPRMRPQPAPLMQPEAGPVQSPEQLRAEAGMTLDGDEPPA